MRKLLAVCLIAGLVTPSFAYMPLSNSQNNLGSFRNGATRGMFYDELDVISASPVSLLEFKGNAIYTNWGNGRYFNDPTGVVAAVPVNAGADRALTYDSAGRGQYFNIGISGNPLSFLSGFRNTRAATVYQYAGSKTSLVDLDNTAGTGTAGLDSEGNWVNSTLTDTNNDLVFDRIRDSNSTLKNYDNRTLYQWNAGIANKDMFIRDLAVGFGIAWTGDSNIRNIGGTKTYRDTYVNDNGSANAGMPNGARVGDSYDVTYADKQYDRNSTGTMDVLFQGQYSLFGMKVSGGLGLRMQDSINPNSTDAADVVTVTGSEDVNIGGTQYFHTGTSIKNRGTCDLNTFAAGFGQINAIAGRAGSFGYGGGANMGTTAFDDKRSGMGPLVRLEVEKAFSKVNLTGVLNYSSVVQNISASRTQREYVATQTQITAAQRDSYAGDIERTTVQNGNNTINNIDLGGKVEFIAMADIKLALGGFIRMADNLAKQSGPVDTVETITYSDGLAANTAVALGNDPSPINGEGTRRTVTSGFATNNNEVSIIQYQVPVGVEIPLSKRWTFGAGTQYIMTKTTTKVTTINEAQTSVDTQTPAGAAADTVTRAVVAQPTTAVSTNYTEAHNVQYTYGVRFDVNKNLTIACNAFLDTAANGVPAGNAARANIFDLDTYRLLAMQAVFKF